MIDTLYKLAVIAIGAYCAGVIAIVIVSTLVGVAALIFGKR